MSKDINDSLKEAFLPTDYEVPVVDGNYMKFRDKENRFRILSPAIRGWEIWVDKRPKRFREDENIPVEVAESADIDERTGEPKRPRHFMAFVVWNYNAKPDAKIQILEITQKKIKTSINSLNSSKAWGNPIGNKGYDILVTKTKTGPQSINVEYSVLPSPKTKLTKEIKEAFEKSSVNLEALYSGEDPFEQKEE